MFTKTDGDLSEEGAKALQEITGIWHASNTTQTKNILYISYKNPTYTNLGIHGYQYW